MNKKVNAAVTGVSRFLPERRLTNAELEEMVDTTDEWIRTRTGIVERRILDDGLGASHMATRAMEALLEEKGLDASEIDLIIVATVTPDMIYPATACLVQHEVGPKTRGGSTFPPHAAGSCTR